jgi:hypothetical protein
VSHEPPRGAAGCHCSGPNQKLAWTSAQLLSFKRKAYKTVDCAIHPCKVAVHLRWDWHHTRIELIRDPPNLNLQQLFSAVKTMVLLTRVCCRISRVLQVPGWCSNIGNAMRRGMYQGCSCSASICTPRGVTRYYPIVAILRVSAP